MNGLFSYGHAYAVVGGLFYIPVIKINAVLSAAYSL